MKTLRCQHEDEYRKLQDELDLQKSKVRTFLEQKIYLCVPCFVFILVPVAGGKAEGFTAIAVESDGR